jgi:peptide/nickel transport system substrate-binding protein
MVRISLPMQHVRLLIAIAAILGIACRGGAAPANRASEPATTPAATPSRQLVIAFPVEPPTIEPSIGSGLGNREISAMTSAFLALLGPGDAPQPYLAEELPSLEKGSWRVLPDGQMETIYRLKPRASWHDGQPVVADDFVFGYQMHLDPEMPVRFADVDRRIGAISALDDHTLRILWKEPFYRAGFIHGPYLAPLPRHTLGELYVTDHDTFVNGAHWREQFIGTGPYEIERWEPGVALELRAHDGFALGKPAIDRIILRFIADVNTVIANLLSGTVDVGIAGQMSFEQNQALEQTGWPGHIEIWKGIPRYLEFQARDWGNLRAEVLDVRVRRAAAHAIDRQAIVDGLYAGKARVLPLWLWPDDAAYPAAERAVTKYPYDPARATQLLREAGWTRGGDGMARNPEGQPLQWPMLNESGDIEQLEAAKLADDLKAVGIATEIQRMTFAQQRDNEFRSKFPAVAYNRRGIDYDSMVWTSDKVSLPENRWSGFNRSGYVNPVVEELWPKMLGTVDRGQRETLLVEALKALSADANVVTTHLQVNVTAYVDGLLGLREPGLGAPGGTVWNTWEWHWRQS